MSDHTTGPVGTWDIEVHRDVMHGQWANCDFVLHIGSTAYVIFRNGRNPKRYATVIEIFTHKTWFRFRRGVSEAPTP